MADKVEKVRPQDMTKERVNALRQRQREAGLLRYQSRENINGASTILSFLFVFAVLMMLFRLFMNPNAPLFSLQYFLETMEKAPSLDFSWITTFMSMAQVDGVPRWLQVIFNIIWTPLTFIAWVCEGIVQLLVYVYFVLKYFFGFVA